MKEWRLQSLEAIFSEIESDLGEKLAYVRARVLKDMALTNQVKERNCGYCQAA